MVLNLATSNSTKWKLHIEPISMCCPLSMGGTQVTALGHDFKGIQKNYFSDFYLEKMGPVGEGVNYPEITK